MPLTWVPWPCVNKGLGGACPGPRAFYALAGEHSQSQSHAHHPGHQPGPLTWPSHAAVNSVTAVLLEGSWASEMVAVRQPRSSGAQSALAEPSRLATPYPAAGVPSARKVAVRSVGGFYSFHSLHARFLSPESMATLTCEANALADTASKVDVGAAWQGGCEWLGLWVRGLPRQENQSAHDEVCCTHTASLPLLIPPLPVPPPLPTCAGRCPGCKRARRCRPGQAQTRHPAAARAGRCGPGPAAHSRRPS